MTKPEHALPALALVDDDYHSARLMLRMLDAHGGPAVTCLNDPETALESLAVLALQPLNSGRAMVIVDLKSSSVATREFVARLKERLPDLLVVAIAPSLDKSSRDELLDAGAAAVFERHADIALYRREAANLISFWARNQRLDAVGT